MEELSIWGSTRHGCVELVTEVERGRIRNHDGQVVLHDIHLSQGVEVEAISDETGNSSYMYWRKGIPSICIAYTEA
eukprot:6189085-Pleurochrysis_carterae.AAC.2